MKIRKTKKQAQAASAAALATPPQPPPPQKPRIEICRSWSFKLNMDRYSAVKTYESRDFFCSAKTECDYEEREDVGAALFAFCRSSVLGDVKGYIDDFRNRQAQAVATNGEKQQ